MSSDLKIEIIEFTDPVCTWCWGSEPILRKIEFYYDDNVTVKYIMGGLVKHVNELRDVANGIGGNLDTVNKQIATHWLSASDKHKMPVNINDFNLFTDKYTSTYPMNIAYKAAQFQNEALANKFLRRMREAVSVEARMINREEVLIELVKEVGLDENKFVNDINSGEAEIAFNEDLKIVTECGVHGFPTFIVKCSNGKQVMMRGFTSYENFKKVITELTNGELDEKIIVPNKENILMFINKFEKVTTSEIQIAFNLNEKDVNDFLKELKQSVDNKIKVVPAGNGFFVHID